MQQELEYTLSIGINIIIKVTSLFNMMYLAQI